MRVFRLRLALTPGCASQRGMTLVELMVALAIAAILATIGFPSMSTFIQNNRLLSQTNALLGSLNQARSHAVARGRAVTVCGSAGGADCDGSWSTGWMTFVDEDGDGVRDAEEERLAFVSSVPDGVNIRLVGDVVTLRFTREGSVAEERRHTFAICDGRGSGSARGVVVFPTGGTRAATDGDGNGVREGASGLDIEC